jgi:hypothetical protein
MDSSGFEVVLDWHSSSLSLSLSFLSRALPFSHLLSHFILVFMSCEEIKGLQPQVKMIGYFIAHD